MVKRPAHKIIPVMYHTDERTMGNNMLALKQRQPPTVQTKPVQNQINGGKIQKG